jgi:predicted ATP-dependent serine protease
MTDLIVESYKIQIENAKIELEKEDISSKRQIELNNLIKENKKILENIYNTAHKRNGKSFRELLKEVENEKQKPLRATGIQLLDDFLGGGIEEETFINLIGESGAGKSTLAMEILLNIAEYNKSVFFSFEMGKKRTVKKISKFELSENQKDNLIVDLESYNIEEIKREITLYANDGVHFFCIDSKMKIEADGFRDDHKKIAYISNELSKLTQKLGVIIILINQISEESLKSGRVSIKGSGDQIYDTDILMVYKKHKSNSDRRVLEIFKNRTVDERTGTLETKLVNNRTVSTVEVEVTNFQSDNDFLGDII